MPRLMLIEDTRREVILDTPIPEGALDETEPTVELMEKLAYAIDEARRLERRRTRSRGRRSYLNVPAG